MRALVSCVTAAVASDVLPLICCKDVISEDYTEIA
jgi:hypothetical protein